MKISKILIFSFFVAILAGCANVHPISEKDLHNLTFEEVMKNAGMDKNTKDKGYYTLRDNHTIPGSCQSDYYKLKNIVHNYASAHNSHVYVEDGSVVGGLEHIFYVSNTTEAEKILMYKVDAYSGRKGECEWMIVDYNEGSRKDALERMQQAKDRDEQYKNSLASIRAQGEERKRAEEMAKQTQYTQLRLRSGEIVMSFYDTYKSRYGQNSGCDNMCSEKTQDDNGYYSLQDALNNGWKFVSTVSTLSIHASDSCTCEGSKIILRK
jgi:hypothetical protein